MRFSPPLESTAGDLPRLCTIRTESLGSSPERACIRKHLFGSVSQDCPSRMLLVIRMSPQGLIDLEKGIPTNVDHDVGFLTTCSMNLYLEDEE